MKPKPNAQRSAGSSAKNNFKSQKQKPNFKRKHGDNKQKKADKPNKPEIRKMIRQQKAAAAQAERERVKAEKEARIKQYKKQRLEKTKIISKRTQRGQPLMKDRMQLLLKQIEEMKRR
ncbi:thyroid transcription factor 1-associated protein 26 [Scaptodrosophila lebanonensis]|uniref:Thyroid transcription factor 1-associated protein 26 n=1 Tax=Drosophila lebanonensis TaxID=7225 RepID=A0A6J2T822_DROLE|nr:thyroid transcription factor 1-associated protein 26 [Scaptodrosophila lebanonensis]XP_030371094.1 thyroid transcription factor 1-associated protein 26 [Scaptodrosophila lebanonensis]XP_030371095.1 thyroid transcription factor 1-associated protein 26 [Scaptodrosophila lebanonensis]XP_030371097.1 thyroid transcription factor 1-associated protein 26 [Scaptodrosophila lebanonensis]